MTAFFPACGFFYICCGCVCLAGVTGCGLALLAPLLLSPASRVPPTSPLRDGPGHFIPRPCRYISRWRGAPSRSARSPLPRGGSGGRGVTRPAAQNFAPQMSRHVGCERVVLGVCQS